MNNFRADVLAAIVLIAAISVGCQQEETSSGAAPSLVRIEPGADAARRIQEALIQAQPGDTIELAAGRYDFTSTLSLDVRDVTVRGQGHDKTLLTFTGQRQGTGGEGVSITSDGVEIRDLAIEDTQGDALKINGAEDIVVRNVRTEWTGEPQETNGAYGIYPVMCRRVLVEGCIARGASDAGIYVGQSEDVVVRRNSAKENVAGIEIENCTRADVYDNDITGNTGGILVFSLPNLPAGNGSVCRVFDNRVSDNNHRNFAPQGNIVGMVPPGTGIMIMAYDQVEVFDNTIANNQTVNLAILSYLVTEKQFDDSDYDPYCEAIHVHDNRFEGGGDEPQGKLGTVLGALLGGQFPDIAYDGLNDPAKVTDGQLSESLRISIHDNGDADFANLDLENFEPPLKWPTVSRDADPYASPLEPLAPVIWEGLAQ
ncbi:MAG: parallel beta-helix domain-containing protein [Pirellulales bacterium]